MDGKRSRWTRQSEEELFEAYFALARDPGLDAVAQRWLRMMLEPPKPYEPLEVSLKDIQKAEEFVTSWPSLWVMFTSFAIGRAEDADREDRDEDGYYWRLLALLVRAIVLFDRSWREYRHTGRRTTRARRARRLIEAALQLCGLSRWISEPEVLVDMFTALTARLDDRGVVDRLRTLPVAPLARPGPEHVRAFRRVFSARGSDALRKDPQRFFRQISELVRREVERERQVRLERPEATATLLEDRLALGEGELLAGGGCHEVSGYSGRGSAGKGSKRALVPSDLERTADEAVKAGRKLSNLALEQGIKPQRLYDARRRAKRKSERLRDQLRPI